MRLSEIVRMALVALAANRLRTLLSILGVVIGVASVVMLVSIGSGSTQQITSQISALGSNLIDIRPGVGRGRNGFFRPVQSDQFTLQLAETIQARVPGLAHVIPVAQGSATLSKGPTNTRTTAIGVTPAYPDVVDLEVASGRFLRAEDVESDAQVAVLGSQVAETLFGSGNPIGQTLSLVMNNQRLTFRVIGVMVSKGQVFFSNFDNQVYLPVTTVMHRITGARHVDAYAASAVSAEMSQPAANALDYFLYRYLGDADLYRVSTQQSLLDTLSQTTAILTIFLAAIAGISLVVGGIGVMNIMLVSVTERTREVGLRKAIGARRRHIIVQFLSEAALLGLVGGLVGVLLGAGGALTIAHFAGLPAIVSPAAAVMAFCFATIVGIISGVYPAMRASRLDPVLALRYD